MSLSKSARKVQVSIEAAGCDFIVKEFSSGTRTAQDAARSIGCTVAQIVKSLIFKGKESSDPVLVLASGPNRVNEKLITEKLGEQLVKADADFCRDVTGFAIGGIPPIGHKQKIKTFIDEDLLRHEVVWAAAGTPNAVFEMESSKLSEITEGITLKVS